MSRPIAFHSTGAIVATTFVASRFAAWRCAILIAVACHATIAPAQPLAAPVDRLQADAVASFRVGRYSEAYGRFAALADAGHAPSAARALWMYVNGPVLFDKDWDSHQEQLDHWAALAGQPAPVQTARFYPRQELRQDARGDSRPARMQVVRHASAVTPQRDRRP